MGNPAFLLDTSICVFFLRGNESVVSRVAHIGLKNCCLSEITVAELLYGAACSSNPDEKIANVWEFCNNLDIIPISRCLEIYARQKARLRREGQLIDDFDLLIGCAALAEGITLVTDNTRHFSRLLTCLENWVTR